MKKIIIIILVPIMIFLTAILSYKVIKEIHHKKEISKLEKYSIKKTEKIITEFKIKNQNYLIIKYYDQTSSWSHLNILLKEKNNYYKIENINKCDTLDNGKNIYIKENKIYIHCIGQKGNIIEYKINNTKLSKNIIEFNYDNTSNISQLHMTIDKIDDNYIYLSSSVKINNSIKEGEKVKCSFKENKCSYY